MKRILLYNIVSILFCLLLFSCSKQPDYQYGEKVWVHRANEMDKARALQYHYAGLEIDVFYDAEQKCFMIKHDVNEEPLLSLNQWLDSLENRSQIGLWLDLKNLTPENKVDIVNALIRVRGQYKLKGKIIVESMSYDCLKDVEKQSFDISYYIPPFNPEEVDSLVLSEMNDSIAKVTSQYQLPTISGYYYQYEFMKANFPSLHKLLWYHPYDEALRNHYIEIAQNDPLVDVLLIGVSEW